MIATPMQDATSCAGAVTAQYDFCPATPDGEKLFSVRAGIPLHDAFNQLTLLLGSSIASVEVAATECANSDAVPGVLWQSVHLLNVTNALVQSMHQGVINHEKR